MPLFFSLLSISAYVIAVLLLWKSVRHHQGKADTTVLLFWLVAMACHGSALSFEILTRDGINLSLFNSASLLSLLIAFILFLFCLKHALAMVGLIVLPLTIIFMLMSYQDPSQKIISSAMGGGMQIHIVSSLLAYSILVMASIQALTIYWQTRYLKISQSERLVSTLPPLDTMESFLFGLIKLGVLFLTVSLLSGWIFHDNLLAQHLLHKTVLSAMAWLVFSFVLIGKWLYGWRTKTAVTLVLIGSGLLVLAYLGTKVVLELILNRV